MFCDDCGKPAEYRIRVIRNDYVHSCEECLVGMKQELAGRGFRNLRAKKM